MKTSKDRILTTHVGSLARPAKLRDISEKLIVSHHDNNYASAVKNLTKVEAELAATTKDTPAYVVNGLRERELIRRVELGLRKLLLQAAGSEQCIRAGQRALLRGIARRELPVTGALRLLCRLVVGLVVA